MLSDARAFTLRLGDRAPRNEWQYPIERLLECQQTGSCYAACNAFVNAVFLNLMLDLNREWPQPLSRACCMSCPATIGTH
jgi:hypothetical protein